MMQNMTSCPDQNDTAVITGGLSFKQKPLFILQSWTKMSRKMDVAMSSFKIKFLKALHMIWNPLFSSEFELLNLYLDFLGLKGYIRVNGDIIF